MFASLANCENGLGRAFSAAIQRRWISPRSRALIGPRKGGVIPSETLSAPVDDTAT